MGTETLTLSVAFSSSLAIAARAQPAPTRPAPPRLPLAQGDSRAAAAYTYLLHYASYCLSAHALNDGGDESRLEVDYPLGGLRDAEDEVLDEVGDASVGDDEEPRDGAGHALGQVVALSGACVVSVGPRVGLRAGRRARYQLETLQPVSPVELLTARLYTYLPRYLRCERMEIIPLRFTLLLPALGALLDTVNSNKYLPVMLKINA